MARSRFTLYSRYCILPAVLCLSPSALVSAETSGNLLCALVDVVACDDEELCLKGSSRDFDLPEVLVIDLAKEQVRGHEGSGIEEVSPIRNSENTGKQLILQGVEDHRGWTIAVDHSDKSMALTSSGSGVNLMIFGSCTAN